MQGGRILCWVWVICSKMGHASEGISWVFSLKRIILLAGSGQGLLTASGWWSEIKSPNKRILKCNKWWLDQRLKINRELKGQYNFWFFMSIFNMWMKQAIGLTEPTCCGLPNKLFRSSEYQNQHGIEIDDGIQRTIQWFHLQLTRKYGDRKYIQIRITCSHLCN